MYMKKWIMICACVAAFQTALAQRIGQAKAKPYWFALCLADVFIFLQLDTPLFVALISEGRL